MKTLKLNFIISMLLIGNAFAQESFNDVARSSAMQKQITSEMHLVSDMENTYQLVNYLNLKCESAVSAVSDNELAGYVQDDCVNKIEIVESLDFETARDQILVELQEMQTSSDMIFGMTKFFVGDMSAGEGTGLVSAMLIPVGLVIDIAFLPFALLASLVTGF